MKHIEVVAAIIRKDDKIFAHIAQMQVHTVVFQHALDTLDLQADNLFNLRLVERQEHDSLIDTVQEFRTNGLLQHIHYFVLGFFYQQVMVVVSPLKFLKVLTLILNSPCTHLYSYSKCIRCLLFPIWGQKL